MHRVGVYVGAAGLEVRVDGDLASPGPDGLALGGGSRVTTLAGGLRIDLPDGSVAWALSVGRWGINAVVRPSAALRASGSGLLARVRGSGMRVPPLPDGTILPLPSDDHQRYDELYRRLAPAWQVTTASSLFDYVPGTSAAAFADPTFPSEDAVATTARLDPATRAAAVSTCSVIVDPDLRGDCAFDVAVTGSPDVVATYAISDRVQGRGVSVATPPATPPAAATPTPVPGALPADVHVVGGPIRALVGSAIGPDGTVYVSVMGIDDRGSVLGIEPATGRILATASGRSAGTVVFAAGSAWVGDFQRGDTGCVVTRLDPVTLAVQANVTTACDPHDTTLAALGDDVWFVDPAGAGASGTGAHLRRIDASSDAVAGAVALPFTGGFLRGTGSALVYGDQAHGWYRLLPGGTAFEAIGSPGLVIVPGGQGVWTLIDGLAELYTGPSVADERIPVDGMIVGADGDAVYAEVHDDATDSIDLWRYPTDGTAPERLATSASIATAEGLRRLAYTGTGPLLTGPAALAKAWAVESPDDPFTSVLVVQSIPRR